MQQRLDQLAVDLEVGRAQRYGQADRQGENAGDQIAPQYAAYTHSEDHHQDDVERHGRYELAEIERNERHRAFLGAKTRQHDRHQTLDHRGCDHQLDQWPAPGFADDPGADLLGKGRE